MAEKGEVFVTREEAAMRLGFSVGELRRRERLGQIKYAKKGSHNTYLYRVDEVKGLADLLASQKGRYTNDEAVRVFELLREGKSLVDCVVEGKVQPESVEAIAHQYAVLTKGIFLSKHSVDKINAMVIDGPLPVGTEDDMLEFFQSLEKSKCMECDTRPRAFCTTCVKDALRKAREQAKEKMEGTDEL